jgi:ribosome biogenesis GTPase / thiamine phosphate phosphatase
LEDYLTKIVTGLVIKAISGFYTIKADPGQDAPPSTVAQLPGRLKQERQNTSIVAVGDRVSYAINQDKSGTIESIAERKSVLSRSRPVAANRRLTADQEQVLVANLDQVIFIFSAKNPWANPRKLDRFLIVAEMNHIPAVVCINKIDLDQKGSVREQFQVYEQIGYPVLYTSATKNRGIDALRTCLHDRISVFAGSSGVGKSSLLNAVQPGLGLKINAVSKASGKGLHTTRYAELIPLDGGGYVADTPGIRGLALFDVEPSELDAYFREIAPLVERCQFSDCSHRHEPGCAVLAAVERGDVSSERYDSYLRLRDEHERLDEAAY